MTRLRDSRWVQPGWSTLPLRLFLGVTFAYAGLYKLTDSTYLNASKPTSIQQQMAGFEHTSPIHGLISIAGHAPVAFGLLIAFGELAVGIGVLLGLFTRVAALGGMLLSLTFFLTVSFHAHPYFYGSDIAFLFAWTPIVLVGAGTAPSLDLYIRRRTRAEMGLPAVAADNEKASISTDVDRRTLVRSGFAAAIVGVATLAFGGLAAAISRTSRTPGANAATTPSPSASTPATTPNPTPSATADPTASGAPTPTGTPIVATSALSVGQAKSFSSSSGPAYLVHPDTNTYAAFSAICTHQGCTVAFEGATFNCPCHGSIFSASTGQVEGGPAPSPLPSIPVTVQDGQVYTA
jgi:thiosulfate dehydrogenase (quinone) large subunit